MVRSDHKPLVHLYSLKDPSSRLTRIRLELEEYNFKITHIPGKHNVVADALSRISINELKEISPLNSCKINRITTRSMSKAQSPTHDSTAHKVAHDMTYIYEINNNDHKGSPYVQIRREPLVQPKNESLATQGPDTRKQFLVSLHRKYGTKSFASFRIDEVKDEKTLYAFLSKLIEVSNSENLNCIKILKNESIFETLNVSLFKELGNEFLKTFYVSNNTNPNKKVRIILIQPLQSVTNANHQLEIIKTFHNDPILGGHPGFKRLLEKIKSNYRWKNMNKQIANYVKRCHECQINKPKVKNIEPLKLTSTPQRTFDKVVIDTIGPLHRSIEGNAYVVTMMCDLSKYLVSVATKNKEAKTIARAIFDNLYLIYGHILEILADCGTEYLNETLRELLILVNTKQSHSTPYHPQTVGTVERNHRVFNEYLRAYLSNEGDWETYLKYYTFCYNTTPHTSLNHEYSPFEIVFGKKPFMPSEFYKCKIDPIYNIDNYAKEVKFRFQNTNTKIREILTRTKLKTKEIYDKQAKGLKLHVNDKVMVLDHTRNKHEPIYLGPFVVIDINGENVKILNSKNKTKLVHKNNLRKYIQ